MAKNLGSDSLFKLAIRAFPHLRFSWWNFLFPLLSVGAVEISYYFAKNIVDFYFQLNQFVYVLICFNGALFGFLTAGLALYVGVQNENILVFMTVTKPNDMRFSFLKLNLLTYLKSVFWIFASNAGLLIAYFALLIFAGENGNQHTIAPPEGLKYFTLGFVVFCQSKLFVEIKIFIFNIYQHSFEFAQLLAQQKGHTPIDERND